MSKHYTPTAALDESAFEQHCIPTAFTDDFPSRHPLTSASKTNKHLSQPHTSADIDQNSPISPEISSESLSIHHSVDQTTPPPPVMPAR
ncbi:hypothetical protein HAX54_014430, partial [Datura stramonium]|nr:hypothetical protein [Datura stramonium]